LTSWLLDAGDCRASGWQPAAGSSATAITAAITWSIAKR
jgi:hypothetical protein